MGRKSNSTIKSNYQKRKERYKFELRDKARYIGKLYEMYKDKIGEISSRSFSKGKVRYYVTFEDGHELYFPESVLVKVENIKIENIESEEKSNENN